MEIKDLEAGCKMDAMVIARGVRENTRLDGALEAFADLECTHFSGEKIKTQWTGLLLTRDGGRNSRTFRCLDALGCTDGNVVSWLNADFKPRRVSVTVGERPNNKRPLEPFKYIEWINRPAESKPNGDVMARLKEAGLGSAKEALTAQKRVGDARINDEESMPF